MDNEKELVVKDTSANPAPLGLLGFGLTTILLNLHNAGLYDMNAMILAMGIFYGGIAQIIVGILEWKKGNTFGTTAFISYGFFWLSLVTLIIAPVFLSGFSVESVSMGWFLTMWGILTVVFFIGTLRLSRALQFVFGTLVVLFFLLAAYNFTGNSTILTIAGFEGVLCGLSAFYVASAHILNDVYKRTVLPLWPVR